MEKGILKLIKKKKKDMRPAEKRVADVVLKNPAKATSLSTAAISKVAEVSEPTISRFCHAIGLSGFPELKIKLARDLATEEFAGRLAIDSSDQAQSYSFKVLEAAQSGIGRFANQLNFDTVEKSVQLMLSSERLFFFGTGASGPVVMDAVYKFMKLKPSVSGYTDDWSQRMVASSFGKKDCVVCISYTGRTIGITNLARLARERGAKVIVITKENSPLTEFADRMIPVEAPEENEVYLPRHSRLVHFCAIEVLAAGYTLALGPKFRAKLEEVQKSLEETRMPKRRPKK